MPTKLILCILLLVALPAAATDDEADQYFRINTDFAASHILVAHKRADSAKEGVTRTKKEAEEKAQKLLDQILKDPESFEAVARIESDGPSSAFGGKMPPFKAKSMAPSFEAALKKMIQGEIFAKPVKTKYGYHIIRRESLEVKHFGVRGILITHNEAQRIRGIAEDHEGLLRSRDMAKGRIDTIAAEVTADNFQDMVTKYSDLQGANRGFMGVFKQGDAPIFDQMIGAVSRLKFGELSKPLDTQIGFLIMQRIRVEKLGGSQIWISWLDADQAPDSVYRLKKEAAKLAKELCAELKKKPGRFEQLARKHSDGPFAERGGLLPEWFAGQKGGTLDRAVLALPVGGITAKAVETPTGFYILRRNALR